MNRLLIASAILAAFTGFAAAEDSAGDYGAIFRGEQPRFGVAGHLDADPQMLHLRSQASTASIKAGMDNHPAPQIQYPDERFIGR